MMGNPQTDKLYELLPAVYRIRDAHNGEPLRALMGILQTQFDQLQEDMGGLYDDAFIETCAEWAVPYIADLLGVRLLHNIESTDTYSQRAIVANTLSYRRRKGTLLMLEDLAADVTGWGAHAVEFFQLLGWTQNLNHQRYDPAPNPNPRNPDRLNPNSVNRVGSVNLRSLDAVDRIDGPFDRVCHTADIRPPSQNQGWHNIRNLGFFLWRLQSYPMTGVSPRASGTYADGFHFSPLGNPIPLFNNADRKTGQTGLRQEVNVPGPIRSLAFYQNPEAYYGADPDLSLAVYPGTATEPSPDIMCKDLSNWSPPPPGIIAIDVRLGRLAFAPGETPGEGVTVAYHYGFSADMGGGPYERQTTMEKSTDEDWVVVVAQEAPSPLPNQWRTTIAQAIDDWDRTLHQRAVITVTDNGTYNEHLNVNLEESQHLIIQADNRNRPLIRLVDETSAPAPLNMAGGAGQNAALSLNGLLIEGALTVADNSLGKLEVVHSTLVPGGALDEEGQPLSPDLPGISAATDNDNLSVIINASIVGPLRLPEEMAGGLQVTDSIIDAPEGPGGPEAQTAISQTGDPEAPGPVTILERTTVFGRVRVRTMELASEVIFTHPVHVSRRQTGCMRYSYVDDNVSATPRRFRCQPDLALETRKKQLNTDTLSATEEALIRGQIRPAFTAVRYGHPGYGQLDGSTAQQIRTGAESGAEMGAFEQLKQPQREANLNIRLKEYMPYSLEAGIIYAT